MADKERKAYDDCRRFESLASARFQWEQHWEEIAERVLPSHSGAFTRGGAGYGSINTFAEAAGGANTTARGSKRTNEMVDPTAALALPKFSAAHESMLTPRGQTWHRLIASNEDLMKNRQVQLWYDQVLRILFRYRYAPNANFAGQVNEVYTSLGAFGTGSLFVDALDPRYGGGLRYRAVHLAETYFAENHQGIIDTAYRKFEMTARQIKQMFTRPGDIIPDDIEKAFTEADGKQDKTFTILHCVYPRVEGYDPNRIDVAGMPYVSRYIFTKDKTILRDGGYSTFPFAISRYVQAPGETYGRSPAMLALPGIKVLNEQKKTILKQGHRAVDPILLAYDDGIIDTFSLRPGAINPGGVSAEGRPLVHALPTGSVAVGQEMMDAERLAINDAFLVTLFQILVESPQMTATEVLQRAQEKGQLLSPTMGRQQSEFLGPLIDRELDVLAAQNLLPPPPSILQDFGVQYEVVYDSPLSRAQRAEEGAGILRYIEQFREYAAVTGDLSPLDWLNMDAAAPDLAHIFAVPARWTATPEEVMQKREARAQQAQAQQMIEAAPAAAGVLKAMPQGGA